jgi:hypothetical protein
VNRMLYGLLLLAVITVNLVAAQVNVSPGSCSGQCIQTAIDANPPGTTYILGSGTFYNQTVNPHSGDIFQGTLDSSGNKQTILSGAIQDAASSVVEVNVGGVNYWTAPGPSTLATSGGDCDPTFPLCNNLNDLFIDCPGANCIIFTQVTSIAAIKPGTAYFDAAKSLIYFPLSTFASPIGHTIEYSYTTEALNLDSNNPSNVTVENMIVEKYTTEAQQGAVGGFHPGNGFVVSNVESRFNHGTGIEIGSDGQILNSYSHHNGYMGMEAKNVSNILMANNEMSYNNFAGYSTTWAAAGTKNTTITNGSLTGNYIHDNYADGIWCDGECSGMVYQGNVIINNAANGIAHEIAHSLVASNNVIIGNGWGLPYESTLGAGIVLSTSQNVTFQNNFLANNYRGMALSMAPRTDCAAHGYTCAVIDDVMQNNTVVQHNGDAAGLWQSVTPFDPTYYTSDGNLFTGNQYCISTTDPTDEFWWITSSSTAGANTPAQWQAGTPTPYATPGNDTTASFSCPRVFIQSPVNGTAVSATGSIVLSAFAADAAGTITSIALDVDGTPLTPVVTTAYNYTSVLSASFTGQEAMQVTYPLNVSSLSGGSHTITAVATNSAGQTASSGVTLVTSQPANFQIGASALSPATVMPGDKATSTITVSSLGGFNLAKVAFSCASISLNGSPATILPPACAFGSLLIANGVGTATLTVTTTGAIARLAPSSMRRSRVFYAMFVPIAGISFLGAGLSSRRRKLLDLLLICLMLSGLIFLVACGGGSNNSSAGGSGTSGGAGTGTPAGTYSITAVATSGSIQHKATLTLTVQ